MPTTAAPRHLSDPRAADAALARIVDQIEQVEHASRALDAKRVKLLADAVQLIVGSGPGRGLSLSSDFAHRVVRSELATALQASEYSIDTQLSLASALVSDYPPALEALQAGKISLAHARVISDAGNVIGVGAHHPDVAERQARYCAAVLPYAMRETPARLRPIARRLAEEYTEATIDERHQKAVAERRVCVLDGEDGMADLYAHLPAVEAHAIYDRLTQLARNVKRAEQAHAAEHAKTGDTGKTGTTGQTVDVDAADRSDAADAADAPVVRGMDEIRADLALDLLLASDPAMTAGTGTEAIRGNVNIMIPADSLGITGTPAAGGPAVLARYGVIDTETARTVTANVPGWNLVTAHPETGEVLSVDRYRPSEQMRRMLAARDMHCRFPGCRAPISRCDIDHTIDAAKGGATATDNLAHICRGHHVLKHQTGWEVVQLPGGVLKWVSPTGRTHIDRPPSRVYFQKHRDGSENRSGPQQRTAPQQRPGSKQRAECGPKPPGPAESLNAPNAPNAPMPPDTVEDLNATMPF